MKKQDFFEYIKEAIELDSDVILNEETSLLEFEEYDSLSVLSLIAMIDQRLNKKLKGEEFLQITTVKSLMVKIGIENFE